jgi:hypothetical protein
MAELADLASPDELSYKRRRNGTPSDSERTDRAGVPAKPAVPAPGTSAASMRISFFGDRLEATAVLLNQEDYAGRESSRQNAGSPVRLKRSLK